MLVLALGALVSMLAGCGSSSSHTSASSYSPSTARTTSEQATTTDQASSESSECPLTEDQLSQIIGVPMPQVPGPPTRDSICTFNETTSAGVDLTKPGVNVIPFSG